MTIARELKLLTLAEMEYIAGEKDLYWQYREFDHKYLVWLDGDSICWTLTLYKGTAETADFETRIKPSCNFPSGQKFSAFAVSDYEFMPMMLQDTCPAGGSKKISLSINEKCKLSGGKLVTDGNAVFGDWCECAVEDTDGLIPVDYRDAAWPVLKVWLPKWGHDWKACSDVIETDYAGTPFPNFHVTLTYHSTGAVNVGFLVNFMLHRPI